MKRLILFCALLGLAAPLQASTVVPDTLTGDVQWDSSQSPYIIQGKVDLPAGSSLQIGPGVKVLYQGVGELAVEGTLVVAGSAAAPVVFDMSQSGIQSQFFLNGAQAQITNAKFLGGIFLGRNAQLNLESSELTKGSGIYLQGKTTAYLRNNKIYGNATGAVLDGADLKATFVFDTLVQNTYGLDLKNYAYLKFLDNSVHDNGEQVLNETHGTAPLGGNYWGSTDSPTVHLKMRGQVDLTPLKDLKDVLRVYIMTQLPEITVKQSQALVAKEKREAKAEQLALKKFRKEQAREAAQAAAPAPAPGAPSAPAPPVLAPEVAQQAAPPAAAEAPAESAPEAVAEPETGTTVPGVANVKPLPPAAHSLPPQANLPPEQDVNLGGVSAAPSEAAPEAPAPPAEAPAAAAPAPPSVSSAPAPPMPAAPPSTAASPELPALPVAPAASNAPAPPAASNVPPPPAPASSNSTDLESIPPPPQDMGVGLPAVPAASAASSVPPPPAAPAASNPANGMEELPALPASGAGTAPPSANSAPPPPPLAVTPQGPVTSTGNTKDDLEAPSADMNALAPQAPSAAPSSQPAPAAGQAPATNDLALPPIQDLDVAPPKDLDLPPADDLGNLDLNTKK